MAGSAENTRRPLNQGRASIDGELGFAIENDEHLLNGVVEMMADARASRNLAPMQKIEFRCDGAAIEQRGERHSTGAAMHSGRRTVCRRVGVYDSLGQSALRSL